MQRWFARVVVVVMAVFLALTLINATTDSSGGAWLAVASVACVLALMVAVGPGRFR